MVNESTPEFSLQVTVVDFVSPQTPFRFAVVTDLQQTSQVLVIRYSPSELLSEVA
ncbi:hypothetical protein BH10PLA2_BH10PLA2_09590 [soil metagenome]